MKKQKVVNAEAKKTNKVSESLDNINEKIENTDDVELTDVQLDVVSGGTINPEILTDGKKVKR